MGFPVVLSNNSAGSTCLLLFSGFESLSLVSLGGDLPGPRPVGWLYSAIHSRTPGHLLLLLRIAGPVMPFKFSFAQGQSWQGVWHSGQRACLQGHHPKAKPNVFQGVWGQQEETDLLKLDFSSFVKGHNCDFLCYSHPQSEGHCGSQIPSLPEGTREESRMVCQEGCKGDKRWRNSTLLTQKLQPPPWTKQLSHCSQFFLFWKTETLRKCVLHVPAVNDFLWHIVLFVSKGSERDYQLCVSSSKGKDPRPLIGECRGKSKLGLMGFKMVTLRSQSNSCLVLSLNTLKSDNLMQYPSKHFITITASVPGSDDVCPLSGLWSSWGDKREFLFFTFYLAKRDVLKNLYVCLYVCICVCMHVYVCMYVCVVCLCMHVWKQHRLKFFSHTVLFHIAVLNSFAPFPID